MASLRGLGLTSYEEGVYRALLQLGRSDARTIAERSSIPPTAVYPNLKALIAKGLVLKISSEKGYYEAQAPKDALASLVSKKVETLASLQQDMIPELEALRGSERQAPQEIIALSKGLSASHDITFGFFSRAKKSIHILGWRFGSSKNLHALLGGLNKLRKQGIDVKIISTKRDSPNMQILLKYKNDGLPVRYSPLENFSVTLMDGKECKITLKADDTDRLNLHIKDSDLSHFLNEYFLSVWKKSEALR